MTDPAPSGWLNRTVLGAGLTSFLADVSYEAALAALPGYLRLLEAPAYAVGVIEGTADALANFVKLGVGWAGDRVGRRKAFVVAGYAVTGTAHAAIAFVTVWPLIMALRALAWVGKGLRGPLRDAIIADAVPPADRGKAFGLHRAGDTLGAVVGPLVAAAVLTAAAPSVDPAGGFRTLFLLTLIPGVGSALAFALLVRERGFGEPRERRFWASLAALPVPFRRWLTAVGVFGCGDFSPTILVAAAVTVLAPAHGPAAAALAAVLYAARNLTQAVVAFPAGALSDRVGRRGLLAAGYFAGSLTMAGFAAAVWAGPAAAWALWLLFPLAGVYAAVQEALEGATTADLVPDRSLRGTAYGATGAVNGLGDFVSSVTVGVLSSVWPPLGFAYAAAVMAAGAGLMARLRAG